MVPLLLMLAILVAALSGVPGYVAPAHQPEVPRWSSWLLAVSGILSLAAVLLSALGDAGWIALPEVPVDLGDSLALDALSRWFVVPIAVIPPLAAWFGHVHWPAESARTHQRERHDGRAVRMFLGAMVAGMLTVCAAQTGVVFLFGWEAMALSAYFLITNDPDNASADTAGWHYLAATHIGTLCLFGLFALLHRIHGSFWLGPLAPGSASPALQGGLWALGLLAFGLKAGVAPLHGWKPAAYAEAPSHVSAVLSGVMAKMGIYGLFRLSSWLPDPPAWCGWLLLVLGLLGALYGVMAAIGQTDLKRALAFSSVEHIGIIAMGLGLAMAGRSLRETAPGWADIAALGAGSALLHAWMHAVVKPLLFLVAGLAAAVGGTRDTNRLGGLAKVAPRAAGLFGLASVAAAGLPPLSGFISEWLLFLGLSRLALLPGGTPGMDAVWVLATLAMAALALCGALGVLFFVQLLGLTWLGQARHPLSQIPESAAVLRPLYVLATLMVALGLGTWLLLPLVDPLLAQWSATTELTLAAAPLFWPSVICLAVYALAAALGWFVLRRVRLNGVVTGITWDCGYAEPGPRMQYTPTSFSQWPVTLLHFLLLPRETLPSTHTQTDRPFSRPAPFARVIVDVPLERGLLPLLRRLATWSARLRVLQSGRTQAYFLYMLITLIALLAWR